MAMELQAAKKGGEHVTSSAIAELKRVILDEVSSLETIMRMLYSRFDTVHKAIVHLNGWQQHCARRARIFSNLRIIVDHM